jgi:hypothetical protein
MVNEKNNGVLHSLYGYYHLLYFSRERLLRIYKPVVYGISVRVERRLFRAEAQRMQRILYFFFYVFMPCMVHKLWL